VTRASGLEARKAYSEAERARSRSATPTRPQGKAKGKANPGTSLDGGAGAEATNPLMQAMGSAEMGEAASKAAKRSALVGKTRLDLAARRAQRDATKAALGEYVTSDRQTGRQADRQTGRRTVGSMHTSVWGGRETEPSGGERGMGGLFGRYRSLGALWCALRGSSVPTSPHLSPVPWRTTITTIRSTKKIEAAAEAVAAATAKQEELAAAQEAAAAVATAAAAAAHAAAVEAMVCSIAISQERGSGLSLAGRCC
jgi:hypothetical protein